MRAVGGKTERMKARKKNESESYDVATYVYRNPFFPGMCHVGWLGFWLVGSFLGIYLLISQILIGKIVMESAPLTIQNLDVLFSIGKVGWKLFILSIFLS